MLRLHRQAARIGERFTRSVLMEAASPAASTGAVSDSGAPTTSWPGLPSLPRMAESACSGPPARGPVKKQQQGEGVTPGGGCSSPGQRSRKRRREGGESGGQGRKGGGEARGGKNEPPNVYECEGARVEFHPCMLREGHAELFERLKEEVPWQQSEVTVMGKRCLQPRLTCYMGDDPSLAYTYSRTRFPAEPFAPVVREVKERVEAACGEVFNSVLLNQYRQGQDHLGWHSDNEPLYGPSPTIVSASFGAARDFTLRRNTDHSFKLRYTLGGGAVLVMSGRTQDLFQHSIPKRAGAQGKGQRISLTFRKVVNPEQP